MANAGVKTLLSLPVSLLAICTSDYAQLVGRYLDVALSILADSGVDNISGATLTSLSIGASTCSSSFCLILN